jgi:hypothetical protein
VSFTLGQPFAVAVTITVSFTGVVPILATKDGMLPPEPAPTGLPAPIVGPLAVQL